MRIYNWHKYLLRIVEATNRTIQIATATCICIIAYECVSVCVSGCKYTTIFNKTTTAHFVMSTTAQQCSYCCSRYKAQQKQQRAVAEAVAVA